MNIDVKNKLVECFQEWKELSKHDGQQDCHEVMQACYQNAFPYHTPCAQNCIEEFVIANYCEGRTGFFHKSYETITDINIGLCIDIVCPPSDMY